MTRILIAEDEPDIRALVEFTLKFGGHEVLATQNGAEATEQASKWNPELILLDVRMPKMTGYEACRAIKSDPATKDIPIVFLSAKGQETEVDEGIEAGALAYILKPFAPDHLLSEITKIMEKYEASLAEAKPAAAAEEKKEAPAAADEKATPAAAETKPAPPTAPKAETPAPAQTPIAPSKPGTPLPSIPKPASSPPAPPKPEAATPPAAPKPGDSASRPGTSLTGGKPSPGPTDGKPG